ncbi:MAG: hypothetical protein WD851_20460 [Pirellulales bacterium]
MLRYLRIAWSVAWGVLAISLVLLWWRSYWTLDLITRTNSQKIKTTIGSQFGTVYFAHFDAYLGYKGTGNSYAPHGWTYRTREAYFLKDKFVWRRGPISLNIVLPHWVLAMIVVLISLVVWLPRRFSLRTLLIAMTIIAAWLGLIVSLI